MTANLLVDTFSATTRQTDYLYLSEIIAAMNVIEAWHGVGEDEK